MKKTYETPSLEVVELNKEDVITTSNVDINFPGEWTGVPRP